MKIRVWWNSVDVAGDNGEEIIEVSDNATEQEIEFDVKETAMQHFEFGWEAGE